MRFVQIPVDALSRQALDGLIEEFVTREDRLRHRRALFGR